MQDHDHVQLELFLDQIQLVLSMMRQDHRFTRTAPLSKQSPSNQHLLLQLLTVRQVSLSSTGRSADTWDRLNRTRLMKPLTDVIRSKETSGMIAEVPPHH